MSFSMTVVIPKDSKEEEVYYGTPHIFDGLKWVLVVKRLNRHYIPFVVGANVECSKIEEPVLYTSTASVTYPSAHIPNVEEFHIYDGSSGPKWFQERHVDEIGNHSFSVTATVKLNLREPDVQKEATICQTVQPTGAACNDQEAPKLKDHENRIQGLEKKNEENLIDGKYEQKCAKLEEMVRKLEDRLKVTEAYMESHQKLEEKTEALTNELEKLKVKDYKAPFEEENELMKAQLKEMKMSESELKNEIEHLKTELEVANRKMMQAKTKVELMQHIVVETENTMVDLKQKMEESKLSMKTSNCTESVKSLTEQLATKEAEVKNLIYNVEVMQKKLESEVKKKDEKIARLQGYCNDYLKQNNILHNKLKKENAIKPSYLEIRERNNQLAAENRTMRRKYIKKLEKQVAEADEKKQEPRIEEQPEQFENIIEDVEIQIGAAKEQEMMRKNVTEKENLSSMKQALKKDKEELDKKLTVFLGVLPRTESSKKPSYLEKRERNNRLAMESRIRRKKYVEKLEKEVKELRLAVSNSQQAAKIVDFGNDDE